MALALEWPEVDSNEIGFGSRGSFVCSKSKPHQSSDLEGSEDSSSTRLYSSIRHERSASKPSGCLQEI